MWHFLYMVTLRNICIISKPCRAVSLHPNLLWQRADAWYENKAKTFCSLLINPPNICYLRTSNKKLWITLKLFYHGENSEACIVISISTTTILFMVPPPKTPPLPPLIGRRWTELRRAWARFWHSSPGEKVWWPARTCRSGSSSLPFSTQ